MRQMWKGPLCTLSSLQTGRNPVARGGLVYPEPLDKDRTPNLRRERASITFSSASTGRSSDQRVIIDHIPVREQNDLNVATKDVGDLARVLSKVDPALFGLLFCQGVIKVRDPSTEKITGFDFIFSIPPEMSQTLPCSLRSLLSDQNTKHPLNERKAAAGVKVILVEMTRSRLPGSAHQAQARGSLVRNTALLLRR